MANSEIKIGDTVRSTLRPGADRVVRVVGACTFTFTDGSSGHRGDFEKVAYVRPYIPIEFPEEVEEYLSARENAKRAYQTPLNGQQNISGQAAAARWVSYEEAMQKAKAEAVHALDVQDKETDNVIQPHHYARYVIEPATFCAANKLPFDVANVVKYVLRYDAKNGKEDVLKAKRYCEMLLERIDREDRVAAGENPQDVWKVML